MTEQQKNKQNSSSIMLTRDKLLTRDVMQTKKVEFDDGTCVYVREMTGQERDNFERSIVEAKADPKTGEQSYTQRLENFRAKLAVNTMCDEDGNPLLEQKDVEKFARSISASKLEKIVEAAQSMNSITKEDTENLAKK